MTDSFWSILNSNWRAVEPLSSLGQGTDRAEDRTNLGKDAFMQLLLIQMQSQDPLSPMDGQDFFAQLAQFSILEQMWQLNENMADMQRQQQLLQGSALIGRTVEYAGEGGATLSGVVDGIQVLDGQVFVDVEGSQIPLGRVRAVKG